MVKETRRLALRLHTMGVPYQDEAAALYKIAEYIERIMGVTRPWVIMDESPHDRGEPP